MGSKQKGGGLVAGGEYKEVFVGPLAARREAMALCIMIAVIIAFMVLRFSMVEGTKAKDTMKSYQRKDRVLQDQDPILYRSLLSVVGEVIGLREEEGKWPSVEMLKEESIPPFANVFLPLGLKGYEWTLHDGGNWVDYYGVNHEKAKEAKAEGEETPFTFILRIINLQDGEHPHPHTGSDKDSTVKYSYQVWMYPETMDYPGEEVVTKGWKWVLSANDPNLMMSKKVAEEPGQ